jgi:hypothetical protein
MPKRSPSCATLGAVLAGTGGSLVLDKLKAEAPGIMNWLIRGYRESQRAPAASGGGTPAWRILPVEPLAVPGR